jgi:hypothetical protein
MIGRAPTSLFGILPRRRKFRAAYDGTVLFVGPPSQLCPFFQRVDLHRQLSDLTLQFSNLIFVFSDADRVDYFIS